MWTTSCLGTYFASCYESYTAGEMRVSVKRIQERVDVDKSKTEDNVLAAADLRPAERGCCSALLQ